MEQKNLVVLEGVATPLGSFPPPLALKNGKLRAKFAALRFYCNHHMSLIPEARVAENSIGPRYKFSQRYKSDF